MSERVVELGSSGLKVSRLGTGTNKWVKSKNDEVVYEAYRSLIDAGVNFFDTAEIYGGGKSELLLGDCIRRDGRPAVIASKYMPWPTRLTGQHFMRALDAILGRLGLKTLDLYYIHFPVPPLSIETHMDHMAEALEAGKIRAIGVSNFSAELTRRAAARLEKHGTPLAANEVEYSLMHRQPEVNGVLDVSKELNVSLVAYRPLGRGSLALAENQGPPRAMGGRGVSKEDALLGALRSVAQRRGKSVSQVALCWLLRSDKQVIPIPGATSVSHAK
jgi:aryl-alcohol dehydrogenase-like predicted oxidoreductase